MVWIITSLIITATIVTDTIIKKRKLANKSVSIFYLLNIVLLIGCFCFLVQGTLKTADRIEIENTKKPSMGTISISNYSENYKDGKKGIEYSDGKNTYFINTGNKINVVKVKSKNPSKVTITKKEHFNIAYFFTDTTYNYVFE